MITTDISHDGGTKSFTMNVSQIGKLSIQYTVTLTVDTPVAVITGIGTVGSVLQVGETTNRTAVTAESGTKTWASDNTNVATTNS